MKTIVLDANELMRDWMCTGLKYQLLGHMFHATWVNVYVPRAVFEEVVANHAREVARVEASGEKLAKERKHLGLDPIALQASKLDYRSYLTERFDEHLGFTVLPWPSTPHSELVARAVSRTPPFNEKGSGYRDSLVWADVVELARKGHEVAFVSADRIFADDAGGLVAVLRDEVGPLSGSVELVRDFGRWLIAELPWRVDDLRKAVSYSRNAEFFDYYVHSDFQAELEPDVEELGFSQPPYECEIVGVEWDGTFVPIEESVGPEGESLVKYDMGQTVEFVAEFNDSIEPEQGWRISEPDAFRRVRVEGSVSAVVRLAVLFGGEFHFTVDELSWRRADGIGAGASIYRPELDPNQLSLFDMSAVPYGGPSSPELL